MSIFDASPWLQLPVVLAVAVPLGGLASWALVRLVDWAGRVRRPGQRVGRPGRGR